MSELLDILLRIGDDQLDYHMRNFIATSGIITANIDGKVTDEEFEHIIRDLSRSTFFPKDYLKFVVKQDVEKLFADSINNILKINPGLKPTLVAYIIQMVMADNTIGKEEVNFIYSFGQDLGLSIKEISNIFADMFHQVYNPSLSSSA